MDTDHRRKLVAVQEPSGLTALLRVERGATPDTQPQIQMLRFVMRPGATSGEPYSNAEGGKCGLVVAGTLGLELNGVELMINTGDSFAFPATTLVRFWTIGEETCAVSWVVAPATV